MKELWKNEKKNILLVVAYTLVAMTVYCVWFHSLWHLWYVTLLTGLLIIIIGAVCGYFYVKSSIRAKAKLEEENKIKNIELDNKIEK